MQALGTLLCTVENSCPREAYTPLEKMNDKQTVNNRCQVAWPLWRKMKSRVRGYSAVLIEIEWCGHPTDATSEQTGAL